MRSHKPVEYYYWCDNRRREHLAEAKSLRVSMARLKKELKKKGIKV